MYEIWNENCVVGARKIKDNSIDLMICDPPFGINEASFDKHYSRKETNLIDGYVEAPSDYYQFSFDWMSEAKRILKENGTFYIISGWSNLLDILNAAKDLDLNLINHCIWKFNFGVNTKKKWVTSHYHILMFGDPKEITFNTHCRFGPQERNDNGSLLYQDMEDVFYIKKEYQHGKTKNKNKLPNELIQKLILYSSNEGDVVCDFFMGNFTTAYVSLGLGRKVKGFEMNKNSFDFHYPLLKNEWRKLLENLKRVEIKAPKNQGKRLTEEERKDIIKTYDNLKEKGKTKKAALEEMSEIFGRGRFSLINVLKGKGK